MKSHPTLGRFAPTALVSICRLPKCTQGPEQVRKQRKRERERDLLGTIDQRPQTKATILYNTIPYYIILLYDSCRKLEVRANGGAGKQWQRR